MRPIEASPKRRRTLQLRLTVEEDLQITRVSKRLGVSKSGAVRHLVALADNRTRKLASGE